MVIKNRWLSLIIFPFLFSCSKEEKSFTESRGVTEKIEQSDKSTDILLTGEQIERGVIRVKLSPQTGNKLTVTRNTRGIHTNAIAINKLCRGIKTTHMERLFPYAGKYEERTRREGLHLWYVIHFDRKESVKEVLQRAKATIGVQKVEPVPTKHLFSLPQKASYTFNDPLFYRQWQYNNDGNTEGATEGADINMLQAWTEECGSKNVIVNIVDGGVSVTHPDLKPNLYINEKELHGVSGVDDDDNGFIDDIHGYNFYDNKGQMEDINTHATHVAGLVAARNNNGIGVCGVAGGDGSPQSGVRLLLSQVFKDGKGSTDMSSTARAIKYGADNGAVISQNSWGYANPYAATHFIYDSDKAAIDYFIKYAGCDNEGHQLPSSPMQGGLVIFAAGNESTEYLSYPAAYDKVVAVAATDNNFKKASYSNWGDWVDITAPGGDGSGESSIFSTTAPANYGFLMGTSMACPQVSGVAALIVSKFGKQGFTNKELRKRLLGSLRPYNIDRKNLQYAGKLGNGYIDAYQALATNHHKAPNTPKFENTTSDFTSLNVKWKSVSDDDDVTPQFYRLYYSSQPLTIFNFTKGNLIKVNAIGYSVGTILEQKIENLEVDHTYHFALLAVDRWGQMSGISFNKAKTLKNLPPRIERIENTPIRIAEDKTAHLRLKIIEPESQYWTYRLSGDQKGVSCKRVDDELHLTFHVVEPFGNYNLHVEVNDIFNAKAEIDIPFEYIENKRPFLKRKLQTLFIPKGKESFFDLNTYFADEDDDKLSYKIKSFLGKKATVNISRNILTIKPRQRGYGTIEIIAKDSYGATCKELLPVQLVEDDIVYLVYPIPVNKELNVRLSEEVSKGQLCVKDLTGRNILEQKIKINTSSERLIHIDAQKWAGGTYLLQVKANGKTFEQRFIKN